MESSSGVTCEAERCSLKRKEPSADAEPSSRVEAPGTAPIRVLLNEDTDSDAELELRELQRSGLSISHRVVDGEGEFIAALRDFSPDLILSDFTMPGFGGMEALAIACETCPETPFIFVSGTIGEETAIESLRRGAVDYILKSNLKRLGPSVARALQDVAERRARREAERRLDEVRIRFELFMRFLPGAAFIQDRAGRYQFVNRAWEEIHGARMADVVDRTDHELWPERGGASTLVSEPAGVDEVEMVRSIETVAGPDGSQRHFMLHRFPIMDAGGLATLVGGVAIDFTDRIRAQQKIERLNRVHALHSGINALIVREKDRQELFRGACRVAVEEGRFKLAWVGMLDSRTSRIFPIAWRGAEDQLEMLAKLGTRELRVGDLGLPAGISAIEGILVQNDLALGEANTEQRAELDSLGVRSMAILPLLHTADGPEAVMVIYETEVGFFVEEELQLLGELSNDISFGLELIAKEEKLDYMTNYDSLTWLPNRSLLQERLARALRSATMDGTSVALVLSDIKRLGHVNDTLGRKAGDALLKDFGQRLSGMWPESESIGRASANCFGGIIRGARNPADVAHMFDAVRSRIQSSPFEVGGEPLRISFTAGIAIFPGDGADAEELLKNAEAALKKAKAGSSKYLFYHAEMNAAVTQTLRLENNLRRALEQEEFTLHYQPKLSSVDGSLCGLEALIRWNDPESGTVPPATFVPLLEETGMIVDVGLWVIRQALLEREYWRASGLQPPRIAVNVSPVQLRQANFVDSVSQLLQEFGADGPGLDLEITESLIMEDIEGNIAKLRSLREMGVDIAIDDFGTGYSSLGYMARLPVNLLKIDRSFIGRMTQDSDSMEIVATIISLAHSLKMKVVAEGVETEEQARILKLLRCDEMQGYYFCRPVPAGEIARMLGEKLDRVAT
jgi:diguanylate cyclase (GGDEF)-like protein/PAS domain S-box-containing protein